MDEQVRQQIGPAPQGGRAVTIDDVARLAGVHRSTVSRALSRPDLVREETRRRIQGAVEMLGYRTNLVARSLSVGRSGLLALLVPDCANLYFAEFVKSAQECAAEHEVSIIVASTGRNHGTEVRLVRSLVSHVDGVVAVSPRSPASALRAAIPGCPLVSVGADGVPGIDVLLSNREISRLALDHLLALGHRHIAVIEGPVDFHSTDQRRSETTAWASEHPEVRLTVLQAGENVRDGFAAADVVADLRDNGVTAVTTYCDAVAFGLLMRLVARRIRVPDELSLVGADDVELASFLPGGLTSISLGVRQLGRVAVEAVLGITPVDRASVPVPTIVVRGTTGPARL